MNCIKYNYVKHDSLFKNYFRYLKFSFRKMFYKKNYNILNDICFHTSDKASCFFKNNNSLVVDLLHKKYGCQCFSFKQGYECFKRDLELISFYYGDIFSSQKQLLLKLDNEYSIYLKNTPRMINEGMFLLSLHFNNKAIYDLNFIILDDGILITCLQGCGDIKEDLKNFTKKFYGLRPITFMIFYTFLFAKQIGLKFVYGVNDKYAISNFKRGKKRKGKIINIHNLDSVYEENCSVLEQYLGYKKLEFKLTPIEEIASKKRSTYKKRYEFLKSLIPVSNS